MVRGITVRRSSIPICNVPQITFLSDIKCPADRFHRLDGIVAADIERILVKSSHADVHAHVQRHFQDRSLSRLQGGRTDHHGRGSTAVLCSDLRETIKVQRFIAAIVEHESLVERPVEGNRTDFDHLFVHA